MRPFIFACCALKRHLLALEGDKDGFDSVLKPFIVLSPLPIRENTNFENSYDSPIVNRKAINLFCE
jgi:hypothetical protein